MAGKNRSIGGKITTLVISAVLIAGIGAISFFIWRQTAAEVRARHQQYTATGHVIATAIAEPVAAGDRNATLNMLKVIGKFAEVPYIGVTRPDGSALATIGTAVVLMPDRSDWRMAADPERLPVLSLFLTATLPLEVPVVRGGRNVGTLFFLADLSQLRASLIESMLITFAAVAMICLVAMLAAQRMQRSIVRPIEKLAAIMSEVKASSDFTVRAEHSGDDETAQLADAFNGMLARIGEQDQALRRHGEHLEQVVEERTRDLVVARDAAERANQAKSDFLATMSHEIRTPMNGVMVMAELLAAAELTDRQRHYAEVIARSGQGLLTIINDILDLSKIEAGKLELESVPVAVDQVISDVQSLFWERAASKGLDLAAYVAPDVPELINGDPVRIGQILTNLVNNALKFTEAGCVTIGVRLDKPADTSSATQMVIAVSDTGIGIPAGKLAGIFDAFSQADQTTTRRFGGTGLGLAICKRLVDAMGGEIAVTSTPGRGSRFTVRLALHGAARRAVPAPLPAHMRFQVAVSRRAAAASLTAYLRGIGLETGSPDPDAAAPQGPADVLFADPPALAEFAPGAALPGIVIVVSSLGDGDARRLLQSGTAHDVLMLPAERQEIEAVLDRIARRELRGTQAMRQARARTTELPHFPDLRALVADDNAVNREVLLETLRQLGLDVDLAVDGSEAVAMVDRGTYDLIFMDCSMPVMDGYEAARMVRRREGETGGRRVPIVALTAQVAGEDAGTWQTAGMDRFITKPFTLRTIAECIAGLVGEDGGHGASLDSGQDEPAQPDRPEAILDNTIIADLQATGGDELLRRVIGMYLDLAPGSHDRIGAAANGDDMEQLAQDAHYLKSLAGNIGAMELFRRCDELEHAAQAGRADEFAGHVAAVGKALERSLAAARDTLAKAA